MNDVLKKLQRVKIQNNTSELYCLYLTKYL